MAKLLPCKTKGACEKVGFALWPKSLPHPEGEPAIVGQYVAKYTCARCKRPQALTIPEYHRLPEMTDAHFEALTAHFTSHTAKQAIRNLPVRHARELQAIEAHRVAQAAAAAKPESSN